MFLVLVKSVDDGEATWAVADGPFDHMEDAMKSAKFWAGNASNTVAVVKVEAMFRRSISVTEVEVAP